MPAIALVAALFLAIADVVLAKTINECVNDMCENAGPLSRANPFGHLTFNSALQPDVPENIKKLFLRIAEARDKQYDKTMEIVGKSGGFGDAKLEGPYKAYYNDLFARPFLEKLKYKEQGMGNQKKMVVDEVASAADLRSLSEKDRKWLIDYANFEWTATADLISNENIRKLPAGILLSMSHPGRSAQDALKMEIETAKAAVRFLQDKSPLMKDFFISSTSPERIALIEARVNDGSVDENEAREIIQANKDFKLARILYDNPNSPLMKRDLPPLEEMIRNTGGRRGILEKVRTEKEYSRKKLARDIEACVDRYQLNKRALPTSAQIDQLKKDVVKAKVFIKDLIRDKFHVSLHKKLMDAVDEVDFVYPPTAFEFENSFRKNLQAEAEMEDQYLSQMNHFSSEEMLEYRTAMAPWSPEKEKDDSNPYCDSFMYEPRSDANHTALGKVILSFTTAKENDAARALVIGHEIGHSLFKVLDAEAKLAPIHPGASEQLKKMRKCLIDQHTEKMPDKAEKALEKWKAMDPKAEGYYMDEDFSDEIGGEFSKSVRKNNGACALLPRQFKGESGMEGIEDDPHSGFLFSILHVEVIRNGKIPESCEKYLVSIRFTAQFKSCLDVASTENGNRSSMKTSE